MALSVLLLAAVIIIGGIVFYPAWRDRRILKRPFPPEWQAIVEIRLPFLSRLSQDEQAQLQDMIRLFVGKKRFYGCAGLEITDDMRVTIAAEACLLLLNRKTGVYPHLQHILVYPYAFRAQHASPNEDGTIRAAGTGLLGESWQHGKVILSWDDVESGAADFHDGHNVVLHEFSHQLDSESGSANGAPLLRGNSYQTWARVLSREYESLLYALEHHHQSVMDYYGATNPAEFFAVATETFFEKPRQMAEKHPELFAEFRSYYAVDPSRWL